MSEVLVHGIAADADRELVRSVPVRWVSHRELAAMVSDAGPSSLRAASVLRLHWRVLEDAAASATVLPVQFGTVMRDDQAVAEELLAPRHDELLGVLAELFGRVQLTVKGEFDQERLMRGVLDASPAVARLRERVRGMPEAATYYDRIEQGQLVANHVEQVRERDSARVMERLEPLAVGVSRERLASAEAAVNAAFLIDQTRQAEFRRAVNELEREFEGRVRLRCIGPLPPYSFTDVGNPSRSTTWA